MAPNPFVGAEVGRLSTVLRDVSTQLSIAITALSDLEHSSVGPRTDAAVEAGQEALADALGEVRSVIEDAAAVAKRHSMSAPDNTRSGGDEHEG